MEVFEPLPPGSGPQHIRTDTQLPAGAHTINCEIVVHPGATLAIQPGAGLHFGRGVGLTVLGTLAVLGQPGAVVELKGNGWCGVTIAGAGAKDSRIEHAHFSKGEGRSWSREFDAEGLPVYGRSTSRVGGACQLFDVTEGEVRFAHVVFADNNADDEGGAVHVEQSVAVFDHCTFRNNLAGQGGAVRVRSGGVTATACAFESNGSETEPCAGAAIAATSTRGQIAGCAFTGNAGTEGGALLLREAALHLLSCTFEGNRASENGGALYVAGKALPVASGCAFKANRAQAGGGAVAVAGEQMKPFRLQKCTFEENAAGSEGGALSVAGGSAAQLEECRFGQNHALPECQTLSGGAIFCAAGTRLALNGCQFAENQAARGGAVATGPPGDGDEQAHAHVAVRGGAFQRNSAVTRGGAICLCAGDTLDASAECRFEENRAGGEGGAVYGDVRAQALMVGALFKGNTAGSGGGLFWCGERGRLDTCRFEGNRAEVDAGALASRTPIVIRACRFEDNQAQRGGAIWCADTRTLVAACEFHANGATGPAGGGAIHCDEADGTYQTENAFTRNRPNDVAYREHAYPAKAAPAARAQAARSCWIVTAYYGDTAHPSVCAVRAWRDDLLEHPLLGPAVAGLDRWYRAAEPTALAAWWSARLADRRANLPRLLTAPVCAALCAIASRNAGRGAGPRP